MEAKRQNSTHEHLAISVDSSAPKPKQSPEEYRIPRPTTQSILRSRTKGRFDEFNHPASCSTDLSTASDSQDEDGHNKGHGATSENEEDQQKNRTLTFLAVIEWAAVVILIAALVLSLSLPSLSHQILWGLTVWKWCLTLLVVFCGRLFAGWLVKFAVCLIEHNFMLREKVLYFVYGLRRGVQNCFWLSFILLAWMLVFDADVKASPRYHRVLNKITRLLISILVGSFIWLGKIVVVKMLALSFHVSTFFDRMKESVFHQHILNTLSGEPLAKPSRNKPEPEPEPERNPKLMERSKSVPVNSVTASMSRRQDGKIDFERLRKLSRRSANIDDLVKHVRSKGLSTISKAVDEEIKSEHEAKKAARRIFDNVDRNKNR